MMETNDEEDTMPTTTKCSGDKMTDTNEEEETTPWVTPRSKIGFHDMNDFQRLVLCNTSGI
jgi:hypothetical protein